MTGICEVRDVHYAPASDTLEELTASQVVTRSTPAAVVRAALDSLRPRDYVAFLSYLPVNPATESSVASIRQSIRARKRVASTFGVGPRYLHSTGQYHKGGPNTLVAFVITSALEAHGRRTVRIHLARGAHPATTLQQLFK